MWLCVSIMYADFSIKYNQFHIYYNEQKIIHSTKTYCAFTLSLALGHTRGLQEGTRQIQPRLWMSLWTIRKKKSRWQWEKKMIGLCDTKEGHPTFRRARVTEKCLVISGGGQATHTDENSWKKLELEENRGLSGSMSLVQYGWEVMNEKRGWAEMYLEASVGFPTWSHYGVGSKSVRKPLAIFK